MKLAEVRKTRKYSAPGKSAAQKFSCRYTENSSYHRSGVKSDLTNRPWRKFLFPFKVYSLLGISTFLLWDSIYDQLAPHDWHLYKQVGSFIMGGYLISAVVLLSGSLIQIAFLKSTSATSTFIFGVVDLVIAIILPAFFPG